MTKLDRAPAECADCGRPLRAWGDARPENGETLSHAGRGRCGRCYIKMVPQANAKPYPTETICIDCGRPMRPTACKKANAPAGTVAVGARGRCAACDRRWKLGTKPRKPIPPNCITCGREMRRTAERKPGARVHAGQGRCASCYDLARGLRINNMYGLSRDGWDSLLKAQAGRCASCATPMTGNREPCVDHNHATGRVRALLCRDCNLAEGYMRDPARAYALARYMEHHNAIDNQETAA